MPHSHWVSDPVTGQPTRLSTGSQPPHKAVHGAVLIKRRTCHKKAIQLSVLCGPADGEAPILWD